MTVKMTMMLMMIIMSLIYHSTQMIVFTRIDVWNYILIDIFGIFKIVLGNEVFTENQWKSQVVRHWSWWCIVLAFQAGCWKGGSYLISHAEALRGTFRTFSHKRLGKETQNIQTYRGYILVTSLVTYSTELWCLPDNISIHHMRIQGLALLFEYTMCIYYWR